MHDRIVGGIAQYERLGSFEPFLRQYAGNVYGRLP